MAINEDDTNTDLPEAVDLSKPTVVMGESGRPRKYSVLDNYEAVLLHAAMVPHFRRIPDEEGNLPRRPREGKSEFIDPEMTTEKLLLLVRETLPHATIKNVEAGIENFFGKLKRVPKPKGRKPRALISPTVINGLEARVKALENLLGKALTSVSEAKAEARKALGTAYDKQTEVNNLSRLVARLVDDTARLQKEKADTLAVAKANQAYRTNREEPLPATKIGDFRSKLHGRRLSANKRTEPDKE